MHYPLRQNVDRQRTGSISSVLEQNIIKDVTNDGAHYTNWKEIEPESQMPSGFNQEIIIRLTDANFDITQMNETFISLNIKATLNFSQIPFTAIADTNHNAKLAEDIQRGFFIFVGLKNGSDVIRDYTIYHRGIAVANSLQNDATIESALYHVVEDKDSKNNKKHVHSLYESIYGYDTSACGIYLSYQQLKNINPGTKNIDVNIPVNIPITDLLPFQAFTEYPNSLFGELRIKFRINPNAFVFAQVDPHASAKKHFYTTDYEGCTPGTLSENLRKIDEFVKDIPTNPAYDRGFFQFGTTARLSTILEENSDDEIVWDQGTRQIMISMPSYTVDRCTCVIRGFAMKRDALERERQKYETEPFVIPAQRIDISSFPNGATSTSLKTSQNIALRRVTDFMIYFPKLAQQITCWENPMLQNLHLNTMGHNYPEKSVKTIDPNFIQMQLQAADLSSFGLEATDEFENSLTVPRSGEGVIYVPHTDLTSFVITIPVERSSGAGIYFDGLDTNGQNVSVELRANPIHQGDYDTYYNFAGGTAFPPPPVLAMVMDTYWLFSSRNGGFCHYETSRDVHELTALM